MSNSQPNIVVYVLVANFIACAVEKSSADGATLDASASADSSLQDAFELDASPPDAGDAGRSLDAAIGIDGSGEFDARVAGDAALLDAAREEDVGTFVARTLDGGELCDERDVNRILGDVTISEGCTVEVTHGLLIEGTLTGGEESTIVIPLGSPGVVLSAGATLQGVRIQTEGLFGLGLFDATSGRVEDVEVVVEHGVGVYAEGISGITFHNLTVTGPINDANAHEARWQFVQGAPADDATCEGCDCQPGDLDAIGERVCSGAGEWVTWAAVIGVYGVDSLMTFTGDTNISGFAAYGAAFSGSRVNTQRFSVTNSIGVGVRLDDTTANMNQLTVNNTYDTEIRSVGVLADETSRLTTFSTTLNNNGYGLLATGSNLNLSTIDARNSRATAIWAAGTGLDLLITSADIRASAEVGMFFASPDTFSVIYLSLSDNGTPGAENSGGLVLLDPPPSALIQHTTSYTNHGVGMLIGMGGTDDAFPLITSSTRINGRSGSYGALLGLMNRSTGQIEIPGSSSWTGWDSMIARDALATASDAMPPAMVGYPSDALPTGISSIIGPSYVVGPMFIVGPMF